MLEFFINKKKKIKNIVMEDVKDKQPKKAERFFFFFLFFFFFKKKEKKKKKAISQSSKKICKNAQILRENLKSELPENPIDHQPPTSRQN